MYFFVIGYNNLFPNKRTVVELHNLEKTIDPQFYSMKDLAPSHFRFALMSQATKSDHC